MAIKEPVFPFSKFVKSGVYLGPEMRSTGEAMSLADKFPEAFAKAYQAANMHLPLSGSVFISVNNQDKNHRILDIARSLYRMDFDLVATEGTHRFLRETELNAKKYSRLAKRDGQTFSTSSNTAKSTSSSTPPGANRHCMTKRQSARHPSSPMSPLSLQ